MRIKVLSLFCLFETLWHGWAVDDYWVDTSFSCPMKQDPTVTTCSQVCVQIPSDCPLDLQCDVGFTLCADGSCQASCNGVTSNPCEDLMAYSTACYMGRAIGTTAGCKDTYAVEYEEMDNCCGDDDDYYSDDQVPPDYAGFIAYYAWMSFISSAAFLYYAFNNKICPVGDVLDFEMES